MMFTGNVCLILRPMFWLGVVLGVTFATAEERQSACDDTGTALAAEIEPLKALCPSPSSGTSPECIEALDARYWNRPVQCNVHSNLGEGFRYRPQWWPQPRNDTVVWRQVFEDPLALRREAEAATRDPACRLREGQLRPDLRVACKADSMARLGVLQRACRRVLDREDETNPYFAGWQAEWYQWRQAIDETEDDYWQQVAEFDESELHFAWLMTKCRAVPRSALALLDLVRPPSIFRASHDQRDQLVAAAARLGSVWAIGVGALSNMDEGDVAVRTWRSPPLPLAYVHWAMRTRDGLAYLLAARGEDLAGDAPLFDWRGLESAFTAEQLRAARPVARTIRAHGWPPCGGAQLGDSTWPWMDQPTVVRTKVLRRRIDEDRNIRWILNEDGAEMWLKDGRTYSAAPGEETYIWYHSRMSRATLRRWTDADGTERWIDEAGDEHWLDPDGTEHWIELDGTEWILLPPEPPHVE